MDGSTAFDAVIGTWMDCGGTVHPAGGDCTNNTGLDEVEVMNLSGLTVGATYYIQVYDFYGASTSASNFRICVRRLPPANDNCANATLLTLASTCVPTAGTTADASGGGQGSPCGTTQPDVWYRFVATAGTHQVRVDGGTFFDAVIQAWTDCGGGTVHPAGGNCTNNTGLDGIEVLNLSGLTVGATYYIQLYDFYGSTTATADFNICVILPPANDNCTNATGLTPALTCVSMVGTTASASGGGQDSPCGTTQPDVWYRFVATGSTHQVRVDGSTAFDAVITAWTDCGGTVRPAGGNCTHNTIIDEVAVLNLSGLTIGATYYIQVYDFYGNTTATADFRICVLRLRPANDNCANATLLTPASTCVPTAGNTVDASGGGQGSPCGTTQPDVWYRFVATAAGHEVRVGATGIFFDAVITAWTDCSGTAHPIGGDCQNVNGQGGVEVLTLSGLTVGQTYYIQVYNYNSNSFLVDFNVCVIHVLPLPLELASFAGQAQDHINVLHWETLSEKNVQFHAVERSSDGTHWGEIGRKNGLVNSSAPVKYSLEDRSPLAKAYYRLRSVDFGGQENISATIVLSRKSEQFGITSVFPSPTKDDVTVQFHTTQEETVTVRVLDLIGRLVLEQTTEAVPDSNELPITLQGLQAGAYTVTVSNAAGVSAPVRFVKQ